MKIKLPLAMALVCFRSAPEPAIPMVYSRCACERRGETKGKKDLNREGLRKEGRCVAELSGFKVRGLGNPVGASWESQNSKSI